MSIATLSFVYPDGAASGARPTRFSLCTATADIALISSPVDGDLAYDQQAHFLYVYLNSTWTKVTTGASSLYELLANKDAASGYAGLDAGALLKIAEFPTSGTWTLASALTIASSFIHLTAQPCCSVRNAGTQSISTATFTALTFDTENFDVGAMHSTSSNTSRITIPTGAAGKYRLNGSVYWAANITGQRIIKFAVNGTSVEPWLFREGNATIPHSQVIEREMDLAAADYVEIFVYQDSGGSVLTGQAINGQNTFEAHKLS